MGTKVIVNSKLPLLNNAQGAHWLYFLFKVSFINIHLLFICSDVLPFRTSKLEMQAVFVDV